MIQEIAGLLFFSGIRFFLAPSASVYLGYSFIETVTITSIGGASSFLLFYYFGNFIRKLFFSVFKRKKKFSKRNKFIIKVKKSWGFWGLAFLTPCIFSIPLGGILASSLYSKNKLSIPVFLLCILFWSVVLTTISLSFQ